jgi:hypothetical protein
LCSPEWCQLVFLKLFHHPNECLHLIVRRRFT